MIDKERKALAAKLEDLNKEKALIEKQVQELKDHADEDHKSKQELAQVKVDLHGVKNVE